LKEREITVNLIDSIVPDDPTMTEIKELANYIIQCTEEFIKKNIGDEESPSPVYLIIKDKLTIKVPSSFGATDKEYMSGPFFNDLKKQCSGIEADYVIFVTFAIAYKSDDETEKCIYATVTDPYGITISKIVLIIPVDSELHFHHQNWFYSNTEIKPWLEKILN